MLRVAKCLPNIRPVDELMHLIALQGAGSRIFAEKLINHGHY